MEGPIEGYPFAYYTPQGPLAGITAPKELQFAGFYRSMVLADDDTTYGWGVNDVNQLGLPLAFTHDIKKKPLVSKPYVMYAPKAKYQIVSTYNTCIVPLANPKGLSCQGGDMYATLGSGGFGSYRQINSVAPTTSYWTGDVLRVATPSFMHICIIDSLLVPWCWGRNDAGALGYGETIWDPNPYDGSHDTGPGFPLNYGTQRPIIRSRVVYGA
jgi:alpha-tubulin suppressor-like RCC1 family protein